MKNILLIDVNLILNSTVVESNVDTKILAVTVQSVQDSYLRPVLGDTLYNDLTTAVYNAISGDTLSSQYVQLLDKIEGFLVNRSIAEYIFLNTYKITNKGIQKMTDNSSASPDNADIEAVRQYYLGLANNYKKVLVDYLKANDLTSAGTDKDSNTESIGWFLNSDTCSYSSSSTGSSSSNSGSAIDLYITGGTYSSGVLTLINNQGNSFDITGFSTGGVDSDMYITGGTYSSGTIYLTNNSGQTISIAGLYTGSTDNDTFITGGTYSDGVIALTNNVGQTISIAGLYTGGTTSDVYLTGGTFDGEILSLVNNDDSQVDISFYGMIPYDTLQDVTNRGYVTNKPLISQGYTNTNGVGLIEASAYSNGGLYSGVKMGTEIPSFSNAEPYVQFQYNSGSNTDLVKQELSNGLFYIRKTNPSGNTITLNISGHPTTNHSLYLPQGDGYLIRSINGQTADTTGNVTLTVSGGSSTDTYVTGGTYSTGSITFRNNTGGTFNVAGLYTGATDITITGGTYSSGSITFRNNTGGTFNVTGLYTGSTTVVSALTFNNNILTVGRENTSPLTTLINNFSGVTTPTITSNTGGTLTFYVGTGGTTQALTFSTAGAATFASSVTASSNIVGVNVLASSLVRAGATSALQIQGRLNIYASADGVGLLTNGDSSAFNRLNFGVANSSWGALRVTGTTIEARLGDDSAFTAVQSLYHRFGSGSPEGVVSAPVGCSYSRTDGGANTSLYVKESGTGNTGWIAK